MAEPSTYQSLYRRYRSQRFDQVLGQDHITTALRNAVRDGRVGHAYLFSGPRGTGKTSTARILAKVLNCAAPEDGEPCGKCDNCLTVERGVDIDWLLEQDAASKSKVDDMRDLLDRVPLGTSGNRKVIILDEVHMLSQGAENALLKTLEEPPAHVVFVLATTDPQKVRPTIRSRTQHFEFHLLNADVIAEHVRFVIQDAALGFDEARIPDVVDHVVQVGGGSARDTLSALDQVAALGDIVVDTRPVHAILDAVAARDAGAVLVAVAEAIATGREPRTLGEALIASLRDAFLAVMGAADDRLTPAERDRAKVLGDAMGPARLTRALEVLGEAMTELARKPDPRIVVEVALVRVAQPDTDTSLAALAARVQQLEYMVQSGQVAAAAPAAGQPGGSTATPPAADSASPDVAVPAPAPPASEPPPAPAPAPAPAPPPAAPSAAASPAGRGPAAAARAALAQERKSQAPAAGDSPESSQADGGQGGRPTLGSLARQAGDGAGGEASTQEAEPQPPEPAPDRQEPPPQASMLEPPPAAAPPESQVQEAPPTAPPSAGAAAAAPVSGSAPSLDQLLAAWESTLLAALPIPVRSKWRGGRWDEVAGGTARFGVPNEWHKKACDEGRRDVEQVLAQHFGAPVPVEIVVDGGDGSADGRAGGSARSGDGGSPGGSAGGTEARSGPGSGEAPPPWQGGPGASAAHEVSDELAEVDMAEIAELPDADDIAIGGVELLKKEFGGELITADRPPT
jgi:DNA polymerase-3 subunit gamma/tau